MRRPRRYKPKPQQTRIFRNHQIRDREVRLIDEEGNQVGIVKLGDAINQANSKGLDLIKVTDKTTPPICKISDYGKYKYELQKKEKKNKPKPSELKNIRLTFKMSPHDMETRIKTAKEFLEGGDKVRVELAMRGRERALQDFAKEKLNKFLEMLNEVVPHRVEREIKKEGRGLTTIIMKS